MRLLVDNQLHAQFFYDTFIYLNPLHFSSTFVLILRRTIVCIQLLVKSLCVSGRPVCRSFQSISPSPKSYSMNVLQKDTILQWEVASTSSNPQAWGPPLLGCLWLLIQYIRSYPPHWRSFLHLHPEDAPCRGDRDRLSRCFTLPVERNT
jgi:hypothetical protein